MNITNVVDAQKQYFKTGATLPISFRLAALKKLRKEITAQENAICEALHLDFKKPYFEAVITETSIILKELDEFISNLKSWSKTEKVTSSLLNFPSSAYIYKEPYGNTLVISPWNYPFQLAIAPLIGAVAAGNTVILKPSELTPHTANILSSIIAKVFDKGHVTVVQGDKDVSQELLSKVWDYVFFTGSVRVGTIVAKACAEHLTPVTLELGGKNPCIVHESAKIATTARRLVWGKFINAGQTCIAPDYILVHASIKKVLVTALKKEIEAFYGSDPEQSPDFARISHKGNFERLSKMLKDSKLICGGTTNEEDLYISPTLLDEPALNSNAMETEIFGPILPIISYTTEEDIHKYVSHYHKPLSFYVFAEQKAFADKLLKKYSFGGGVKNDSIVHFVNKNLPFGGVGQSGMGAYHGKRSFETFSHKKSVVKRGTWIDIPLKYAPYKNKLKWIKSILKWT
ncbi:aldehyde dehydrogenase [Croceibacter atlanticus]|uniref:aldehyde dehydrogenase n=1 Tax=Croceibacter atlanticus TaxID=313588 RepID=UPI002E10216A|nr:aldehyde dehydrogenase [Croceibacter atlanticus]